MRSTTDAPLGFCAEPGCHVRVNGRCPVHQSLKRKAQDLRQGSARDRGYDTAWDRLSADFRAEFPFCGMRADGQYHAEHSRCVQSRNLTKLAEVVDHIVPLSKGGARMDRSNLASLCRACNTAKGDR